MSANGRFQKGNPGRSADTIQQKRILRDLLSPKLKEAAQELIDQLSSEETKDRQWAVKTIIEYTAGKPDQAVDVSDDSGTIAAAILQIVRPNATVDSSDT